MTWRTGEGKEDWNQYNKRTEGNNKERNFKKPREFISLIRFKSTGLKIFTNSINLLT